MAQRDFRTLARRHLPLAGILVAALAVRLFRLTWPGIWSDEGFSIFLARSPLPDLMLGTANDLHPPLFYLLLKVWLLPGFSEVWVRLFSLLWGVAAVGLTYHIGRRLFRPAVGDWAALFLALSPLHTVYSREVRMYIVLVFLSALSLYLAWRWAVHPFRGAWAGCMAATLLALYTQNLALFLLPVENILVVATLVGRRRWGALGHWLLGQGLLLLGYLPWLPITAYQALFHQAAWLAPARPDQLRDVFPHLLFGEPRLGQETWWLLAAYLWMAAALAGIGLYLAKHREPWENILWGIGWFLLLAGILVGMTTHFPIFQEKQFLMLTVPMALLAGWGIAALPRAGRIAALLLFLILVAPSFLNLYGRHEIADHPPQEAWRELAAYMESHIQPGDALVIHPGAAAPTLDLYFQVPISRTAYPQAYDPRVGNFAGQVATWQRVEAVLRPLAEGHRRIWLVECCLPTFWDPERYLPAWLESWGRPVDLPHFPGLEVRLYAKVP
ncbi:MAG: glycosyltransferase family 39 protein [Chloroflexia bacterium]